MTPFKPMLCMLSAGMISLSLAGSAQAQTLVFNEGWESGSTLWRTVDSGAITLARDTAVCSSQFARETVLFSGGRTFVRAGIPAPGGRPYCLTAWVRGSTGTQPFVGINLSNAAGTPGAEHWLIGHVPWGNGYGGNVVNAPADGAWHWIASPFTLEAGATHVVIKTELFSGGTAGSADFDDVQLWDGACPTAPTGAAHVACAAPSPVCSSAGRCVQCAASSDCGAPTAVCNTASNVCVGCLANTDCAAPTARCDTARTTCVACLSNADCGGATPVCNAGACIACRGDADCGGATPACLSTGACGECSASNRALCTGDRGVCDVAAGRCAQCTATESTACTAAGAGAACVGSACGCNADSDCGGALSGRVCDTTTHLCAAGCAVATGRNGCPDGQFCTSGDATVGRCTMTCNFDADCARTMPARPLCLPVASDMSRCVECTATALTRCTAAGRGAACLTDGTCGCSADADCGDTRSGRVCNATSHACEAGCRDGGNGCPDGMTCTAGVCATTPVDAGVDVPVSDVPKDVASDITESDASDAASDVSDVTASDVSDVTVSDVSSPDATVDGGADAAADVATDRQTTDVAAPTDVASVNDTGSAPADTGVTTDVTGDGCGCRVPGGVGGSSHGAFAALAFGVVAFARRRRRAV